MREKVKCVLGFLLAVVIIVAGIFGFDVKVDTNNTNEPASVEDSIPAEAPPVDPAKPVEPAENVEPTVPAEPTENPPAESAPTEEGQPSVDESVEEVAPPADDTQDDATVETEKGEVEDA